MQLIFKNRFSKLQSISFLQDGKEPKKKDDYFHKSEAQEVKQTNEKFKNIYRVTAHFTEYELLLKIFFCEDIL